MITAQQAESLKVGDVLLHATRVDRRGRPVTATVNGRVRLWPRSPVRFEIPVTVYTQNCVRINETNSEDWRIP